MPFDELSLPAARDEERDVPQVEVSDPDVAKRNASHDEPASKPVFLSQLSASNKGVDGKAKVRFWF